MEFARRDEFRSTLEKDLAGRGLSNELASLIANNDELSEDMSNVISKSARSQRTMEWTSPSYLDVQYDIRWVIKDDDLDIFEFLCKGAGDIGPIVISALLVPGLVGLPVGVVVSLLVATTLFIRKARKKGVQLNKFQYDIILGLKKNDETGLSSEEVREWLISRGREPSMQVVEEALSSLSAIRTRDGTVTNLVNQDSEGKYSAAGL